MDFAALIDRALREATFGSVLNAPNLQFGTPTAPMIYTRFLPERQVPENNFTEQAVRFRTIIALPATRYSPPQKNGGLLLGSVKVELAEQDVASEFTSRDYDAALALLRTNRDMEATLSALNFFTRTIALPLVQIQELQRSQAINASAVTLKHKGDGRIETIPYLNPPGHRAAAGGAFSNDAYDPWDDILNRRDLLRSKGFEVADIVIDGATASLLMRNANTRARNATSVTILNGQVTSIAGSVTLAGLNALFAAEGLPSPTIDDRTFFHPDGTMGHYHPRGTMTFIGRTGQDFPVIQNESTLTVVPNVLGYTAIGRAAGQPTPGRAYWLEHKESKPPRIEMQGWQTSLPVILEAEAIATITGIA